MKPEAVLVIFLVVVALMIVVANDWWKRRLVEKADRQAKKARTDLYANKTRWGMIVAVVVALGAYAFLLNHPGLAGRDFGPLTPLIRWLFSKPG